jgi:deazaflavin-dependent oxidoreductase (nitroreductase family)
MRVVRDGDRAYAVALLGEKSDWVRNVQAHARVRIKLGSKTHNATARILEGEGERARVAEIYRPIAGWYDYVDYANFVWSFPTRAKLLRVHDDWFETGTPVVFELQPDV